MQLRSELLLPQSKHLPQSKRFNQSTDSTPFNRADQPKTPRLRDQRIDGLRGLALVMMVLHHFIYDMRYFFLLDVFAWQEEPFFIHVIRPIFLIVFLFVSGYATRYSRNARSRALKLTVVAVLVTLITLVLHQFFDTGVIYWNMLHTLAIGHWLHVLLKNQRARVIAMIILLFLTHVVIELRISLPPLDHMDYLPLLPWLLYFVLGVMAGQYAKNDPIPAPSPHIIPRALALVGRYGIFVYALHQIVLLALLSLLRALGAF